MKKFGFIVASMGTAVLLAVGAASVAHMVTHPGEAVVEEANAAEVVPLASPSARPDNAPSRARDAGVQLARAESPQKTLAAEVPPPQRVAASRAPVQSSDDDDDDDDGDDD